MFKELEQRPWVCHKSLGENFAEGYDSEVYRMGDYVLKAYKGNGISLAKPLTEAQFHEYFITTNLAAIASEAKPIELDLTFSKKKVLLKVNPILDFRKCECGYVEAISKFIPGHDLEWLPRTYDPRDIEVSFRHLSGKLNEDLGVRGIYIAPINVKIADNDLLIVTDLCTDIWSFRTRA